MGDKAALIVIKKQHAVIMALIGILTPLATGAYTSSSASGAIDTRFETMRTDQERNFVRKEVLNSLLVELREMNTRLGRIEGQMDALRERRR